jgi:hypothetical protein
MRVRKSTFFAPHDANLFGVYLDVLGRCSEAVAPVAARFYSPYAAGLVREGF